MKLEDIKDLDERIKKLKSNEQNKKSAKLKDNKFVYASSVGFRISVELLSGVLVGAGIGYFLDDIFDTKPIMLIVLLFIGAAAGFLNVYRTIKKEEKEQSGG